MDFYDKYIDILEFIPEENDLKLSQSEILIETTYIFLKNNNINNCLISLSGGVDSMVLFEVLNFIKENMLSEINIHICHIHYNNRNESFKEKDFLIEYCTSKNYTIHILDLSFKRGDLKRDLYEKQAKNERYRFYFELNKKYDLDGVFLAHHEDDLIENIFNNIMRGNREITDLTVIKEHNTILNVNVFRPFLNLCTFKMPNFIKNKIYKI